jgi:hypothetical protein
MTYQIPETLIIEGKKHNLLCCPDFPEDDPRIVQVPEQQVKLTDGIIYFSTACWRQYSGSWKLKDDKLFLVKLKGIYNLKPKKAIFAQWFTGVLNIGIEEGRSADEYDGYYEKELHIKIKKGVVQSQEIIDQYDSLLDESLFGLFKKGGE